MLVGLLKQNDWYVYKEYELQNYSKLNVQTGNTADRTVHIDVCAFAHNKKLVIEYDNIPQLRSKSINKLFFSNSDIAIGQSDAV